MFCGCKQNEETNYRESKMLESSFAKEINTTFTYNSCFPENSFEPRDTVLSSASIEFFWQPPLLPFSFTIDNSGKIEIGGEAKIVTPIGEFGINALIDFTREKRTTNINGIEIKKNDFIIIFANKRNNKKSVYKITDHTKLTAILNGKVPFEAGSGYISFDITNASLTNVKFIDYTKIVLVNSSNKIIDFEMTYPQTRSCLIGMGSSSSPNQFGNTERVGVRVDVKEIFQCQIKPYSAKTLHTKFDLPNKDNLKTANIWGGFSEPFESDIAFISFASNKDNVKTTSLFEMHGGETYKIYWDGAFNVWKLSKAELNQ